MSLQGKPRSVQIQRDVARIDQSVQSSQDMGLGRSRLSEALQQTRLGTWLISEAAILDIRDDLVLYLLARQNRPP